MTREELINKYGEKEIEDLEFLNMQNASRNSNETKKITKLILVITLLNLLLNLVI